MTEEEIQELYERRLSEKVATSVDQAIRRRYAWIGAVALVASWVGGAALVKSVIESSVDNGVRAAIDGHTREFDKMADTISEAHIKAQSALVDLDSRMTSMREQQTALEQKREELESMLSAANQAATQVTTKFGELERQSGQITDRFQSDISALEDAAKSVSQLATQVQQIQNDVAALADGRKIEVATTSNDVAKAVVSSITRSTQALAQPTVYLQFSGAESGDTAKRVAQLLQEDDLRVPGVDLVDAKIEEVRFFYEDDHDLATRVAAEVTRIKATLGLPGGPVRTADLTNWNKAKPPKNTVELWMDLSKVP